MFIVGSGVYDRGGSYGFVHQQSSGAGERWEIQGGWEVNGHHFIYSNLSHHWVLEAWEMEWGKVTWLCLKSSLTSITARKNNKNSIWLLTGGNFRPCFDLACLFSFHYVQTDLLFKSPILLFWHMNINKQNSVIANGCLAVCVNAGCLPPWSSLTSP